MQGDYSRFSFDERKHYNGVLVQQGRVQLDADANEQGAIQAHRDRTEAIDTIGPCGAPKRDGGFRVVRLAPGETDLGITAGRMYVDGLLCEVGGGPIPVTANPAPGSNQVELATLDADGRRLAVGEWVELSSRARPAEFFKVTSVDLAGRRLTLSDDPGAYTPADGAVARRAVTYASQPDHPGAPALAPAAGDRLLLYLDVWERHVTAVEDPAIREVALGGPDTTARVQTVCQVKFHPQTVADGLGCADPVPGWPPAASGGRLSATDTAPPPSTDPCRLAPEGGFRGLENRLYRIEIHGEGDLDVATFKWSRDNGAVVFAVDEVLDGGARVRVRRLGRDDVLTLHENDWVEVLDDATELSGQPGTPAKVSNIDQLDRSLTLTPAVPGLDPGRHPRLRRWDMPAPAGDAPAKDRLVTVQAGPLDLEDGIQVRFSGGGFQTGDWWTIPARTLTGRAGPLENAPPRGISHHYCRLALVKWEQVNNQLVANVTDCRPEFPPLTAIEATDVGYEDQVCTLSADAQILAGALGREVADGPVDNVQEALDVLCAREATYQHLAYMAGDGQEGPPGQPLPVQPAVTVRDAVGRPVPNATVTFTPVRPDGTDGPSTQVHTDAAGEAGIIWTLDPAPGLNQLVAEIQPPQGGQQRVRFNARGATPATGGGLCSVTVGDGVRSQGQFTGPAGLQQAVDAAIAAGGATICVLPGSYALDAPIRVAGASRLTIQGSRLETVLIAKTRMALQFEDSTDLILSDLRVTGQPRDPDQDPDGVVRFTRCQNLTVERCDLVAQRGPGGSSVADLSVLLLQQCEGSLLVRDCTVGTGRVGRLAGIALRGTSAARVEGNTIRLVAELGRYGIDLDGDCDACRVTGNEVTGLAPSQPDQVAALGGIHVGSGCDATVVAGNRISGGAGLGIALGSVDEGGRSLGGLADLEATGNAISGMAAGGIGPITFVEGAAGEQPVTDRLLARANRISGCAYGPSETMVVGPTAVRLAAPLALWMGEGIRLLDNELVDNGTQQAPQGAEVPHPLAGLLLLRPGPGLMISRNQVRDNFTALGPADGFVDLPGGILVGIENREFLVHPSGVDGPSLTVRGNDVVTSNGPVLSAWLRGSADALVSDNDLTGVSVGPNVMIEYREGTVQLDGNHIVSVPTQARETVHIVVRRVTFVGNHCTCPRVAADQFHVHLEANSATATGNHVLERAVVQGTASLRLFGPAGRLAAVANVTTNGVRLDPPNPAADLANIAGVIA
jgi:Family of unknown function (DUF6519)